VAVDAGSIAIALTNDQRAKVKDIIITHPHMDHVASLPIFIDDLYPSATFLTGTFTRDFLT
jgi:ribonuclease BN (tRNA processing enzyme)